MIDVMYNYRQINIHAVEFSDEFNKLCIPFEKSLSEQQIDTFNKILDCVSDTAADQMRAAYKVRFKDGVALMKEIQGITTQIKGYVLQQIMLGAYPLVFVCNKQPFSNEFPSKKHRFYAVE